MDSYYESQQDRDQRLIDALCFYFDQMRMNLEEWMNAEAKELRNRIDRLDPRLFDAVDPRIEILKSQMLIDIDEIDLHELEEAKERVREDGGNQGRFVRDSYGVVRVSD